MPDSNNTDRHDDSDAHKAAVEDREKANHEMREALLDGNIPHEEFKKRQLRLNEAVMKEQEAARPTPTDDEVRAAQRPRDRKRDAEAKTEKNQASVEGAAYNTRQSTPGSQSKQAPTQTKTT
jgi:hypothetical protein